MSVTVRQTDRRTKSQI